MQEINLHEGLARLETLLKVSSERNGPFVASLQRHHILIDKFKLVKNREKIIPGSGLPFLEAL